MTVENPGHAIDWPMTRSQSPITVNLMRIAVIPGDGIGVEVTAEAVKVRRAPPATSFGRRVRDRDAALGRRPLPGDRRHDAARRLRAAAREFDAIFIGALGDPRVPDNRHARDILLGTRFELDLYVNYRPVRLLDERLCPLKDRTPADVELRRLPREHRGPLRRRRRPVQAGHRRRDRGPGGDQHLQGRAPDHPPCVRVRGGRPGGRACAWPTRATP